MLHEQIPTHGFSAHPLGGDVRRPSLAANTAARTPSEAPVRAASISCPCCHAASDKPIVDLDRNEVIWRGRLHVGPRKAEILSVLAESFGKPVHVNDLVMRVYASQETPGAHATIYSALSKARPKLRAIGLRVEGVPGTHGIRMFAA